MPYHEEAFATMAYQHAHVPTDGQKISFDNGKLNVPQQPIIPFIEGDGIGPDITAAMRHVIDGAVEKAYGGQKQIAWMEIYAGEKANEVTGSYLPDETLDAIKEFFVAIKGPLTTPVGGGFRSLNLSLRQLLNLYACVRPVRYYDGTPSPLKHPELTDIVIFRENMEDTYRGIEWEAGTPEAEQVRNFLQENFQIELTPDTGLGLKPISKMGSQRLIRKALQYALDHKRPIVSMMHKGNIMKFTEGAFQKWGYELAKAEFADRVICEADLWDKHNGKRPEGKVVLNDRIADITFQHVLLRPKEYSVIACPNLNGDYLSDALAAQVGGMGMAPGANLSDTVALFEATHGTAPKYANQNKVNPTSLILSALMMLEHLGWQEAADLITCGITKSIQNKTVTYDLARQMEGATTVSTSAFGEAVVANMG